MLLYLLLLSCVAVFGLAWMSLGRKHTQRPSSIVIEPMERHDPLSSKCLCIKCLDDMAQQPMAMDPLLYRRSPRTRMSGGEHYFEEDWHRGQI